MVSSTNTYSTTPLSLKEGAVRLLYGSSSNEGRVEVYWKSNWYAVCSGGFDRRKEDLVCRQLGYSAAESGIRRFGYGEGDLLLSVRVENAYCTGYESSFLECRGVRLREYNCFRNQTVGVTCSKALPESKIPPNTIRLVDGSEPHMGRVEIYYNGFWTTICEREWHYEESNVVCKQLGFIGADNTYYKHREISPDPFPILGRLECDVTHMQWTDCSSYDWNTIDCSLNTLVGVTCISEDYTTEGSVRLTGASSENVGRVEIYHHGEWGTICDDGWNFDDAEVVCRQLGFPGALFAVGNAYFGQGNGFVLLDDVSCNGTEHYLVDCRHAGWYQHNCGPGDEAGVQCIMPDVHYPRLANGSNPHEGRVEIWNGHQWTKVCSNGGFFQNEADVVCKELGFDEVDYTGYRDRFGHGYGPPSNVGYRCSENQDSLSQCTTVPIYGSVCRPAVVLGCRNRESSLSSAAIWGIAFGATIVILICFVCIFKRCKSQQCCKRALSGVSATGRTDSGAEPDDQINEGPTIMSTNINEDAPPSYNDVVVSHV
ncbi:Deleted in malignant brain tumors 1 protein [Holothuria leucospilota]|uniref:Deleted in malignant brain tumors 1 protein n=1 Tax=Holothuria leucospilota TaxID=206669 RepID=A0A9Q1BH85_HOLLE|nr:Deleted in malignant brain tumors 1 protein [Holothuria leucospilota]